MDTLHRSVYDVAKAISALVPQGGPVLCRDEMEEWSASEASLFEEALEKYGKDFTDIQQDFVSSAGRAQGRAAPQLSVPVRSPVRGACCASRSSLALRPRACLSPVVFNQPSFRILPWKCSPVSAWESSLQGSLTPTAPKTHLSSSERRRNAGHSEEQVCAERAAGRPSRPDHGP